MDYSWVSTASSTTASISNSITIHTSNLIPNDQIWILPGNTFDYTGYSNTSSTYTTIVNTFPKLKRCRNCSHAHMEGAKENGCLDIFMGGQSVSFVPCQCKEYIPKDNLEYLEWCYDKNNEKI